MNQMLILVLHVTFTLIKIRSDVLILPGYIDFTSEQAVSI